MFRGRAPSVTSRNQFLNVYLLAYTLIQPRLCCCCHRRTFSGRPQHAAWLLRVSVQIKRCGPLSCSPTAQRMASDGERWRPSKAEPGSGSCAFCPLEITRRLSCMSLSSRRRRSGVLVLRSSAQALNPPLPLPCSQVAGRSPSLLHAHVFLPTRRPVSVCSPLSPSAGSHLIAPPPSRFRPRCTFSSLGGSRVRSLVTRREIKSH